jgi:hypothetical protein
MQKILLPIALYSLLPLFPQHLVAEPENYPSPIDPLYQRTETVPDTNKESHSRIYPRPTGPVYKTGDEQLSCQQLDEQLARFESDTYSAKPGFYEDPYTGTSIWVSAIWAPEALTYLGYSGIAEYHENDRMNNAQNRIEALRRRKASLHCYEH